ncbi:type II secretion system F family protein [Alterisphingorhabdus coralli]|uniref:Type II secretion system F family protein n=1 Tax=Alterisphingorhabdus coralli TaxID=3071408 RepID=A0AA97F7D3_9SPHN|nr:type II secretion system F family protein [Parasphingorhabdus sp. SCSIO 66989]WOE74618.1 type II secretion system F family protein [Parasphingorhabdus sp. SCSIO 66989]
MTDWMQISLLVVGVLAILVMLIFALSGPSAQKEGARRLNSVKLRFSESANSQVEAQMRKAIAARKPRSNPQGDMSQLDMMANRLAQTGREWPLAQYLYTCAGLAVIIGLLVYFRSDNMLLSLFVGAAVGIGLPHMVIGFLIKRRIGNFNKNFPDAIELLVRGLRSGLPVTETLSVVAEEIPGPVGVEFKEVTERIKIGRTMEDSLQETAKKLNTPEFNFFCITLAIQRETGGNLAETLANLSDVLRKRSQMKLKIKAMSSESKASAYIVGSLPFIVFGLIWWINPDYIGGFFIDERLIIAGMGGMVWMGIGVFIMAKMVSFEI